MVGVLSMQGCDSKWLRSVLAAVHRFQGGGRGTIVDLGLELSHLAWSDGAPTANSLPGDSSRFRRHPIVGAAELGCSALLMYWPPGHATLPHDHGGLWGVEVVLDGALHVDEFQRGGIATAPGLVKGRTLYLGVGDIASFTSSRYVHRCRNLSNAMPTLTLNVYGGPLERYLAFDHASSGELTAEPRLATCDTPLE